ncbi:uncharacterized protein YktB (UPF0637 family) [Planomicrobium soli]|uniref:UPF0637 protein B0H99_11737 n=1 Tax=Planomicrobium soli TaxID=1176648 RepID=A0A2P8G1G7_9BACL|nr:DUF1054 domain-containing protein [Planomicrobium soli]PSL27725.1 uncharacterized protein YktB (UPF0637 family) [Planomicrobium soli]
MTTFWKERDFEVFETPGLEERMAALIERVRPKFAELGKEYSSFFSGKTGNEFFPHIAKHLRRTINPPKDSWVAFAPYKRGYKAVPHFQIGLWESHVFIILAVIYEATGKSKMAEQLLKTEIIHSLPDDFVIAGDHMKPEATSLKQLGQEEIERLVIRLRDVKKGEFVIGRHIPREQAVSMPEKDFEELVDQTFEELLPLYNILTQK